MDRVNGMALGAAALVVGALGYWYVRTPSTSAVPTALDDGGHFVPAQMADDDDGLPLAITVERTGTERRIRLRAPASDGEAWLTLSDPSGMGIAFGKGKLEAKDRAKGAAFVAAVAAWLHVPVPTPRAPETPLEPLFLTYVRLAEADDAKPEAMKLFLEARGREGELFLDVWKGGSRAAFLEKDEGDREDVVQVLAMALRDGPSPPRTPASDPHLASAAPLLAPLAALPKGADTRAFAWSGTTLLASSRQGEKSTILAWSDLAANPRELAAVDGGVESIVPFADGRMAVVTVHPKSEDLLSSSDPRKVLLVSAAPASNVSVLYDAGESFELGFHAAMVWSPDGTRVAIGGAVHAGAPPFHTVTRIVDVATRAVVAESPAALDASPVKWTGATLELTATRYSSDAGEMRVRYAWSTPPLGAARDARVDAPQLIDAHDEMASPDGRYRMAWSAGSLRVTSSATSEPSVARTRTPAKTFTPTFDIDSTSLQSSAEGDARWIGGHGLVLESDGVMVLDLDSLTLRLLTTQRSVAFVIASPDGSRVVMATDMGHTILGALVQR